MWLLVTSIKFDTFAVHTAVRLNSWLWCKILLIAQYNAKLWNIFYLIKLFIQLILTCLNWSKGSIACSPCKKAADRFLCAFCIALILIISIFVIIIFSIFCCLFFRSPPLSITVSLTVKQAQQVQSGLFACFRFFCPTRKYHKRPAALLSPGFLRRKSIKVYQLKSGSRFWFLLLPGTINGFEIRIWGFVGGKI